MKLLYGGPIAEKILSALKVDILRDVEKPGLAVILIGTNKASEIYVSLKEKKAKEIGMNFFLYNFVEKSSEKEILKCIEKLNQDEKVHGIIVQLPLPTGLETEKIIASIDPKKDVDGFHRENAEKFLKSEGEIFPVFPHAIMRLAESSGLDLKNKKAAVIANSKEFGKIMCAALAREGLIAEYITTEDVSRSLSKISEADVLVSAVGLPGLLRGEMFKQGAIVVDGGIEKVGNKIVGDVDFGSIEALEGFITPVPGGVGPVTIACLLENTFLAFNAKKTKIQKDMSIAFDTN